MGQGNAGEVYLSAWDGGRGGVQGKACIIQQGMECYSVVVNSSTWVDGLERGRHRIEDSLVCNLLVQASSAVELVAFWAGVERLSIGCNGGRWEMEMEE